MFYLYLLEKKHCSLFVLAYYDMLGLLYGQL